MVAPRQPVDSIVLQNRDLAILRDLFECRVMTGEHVTKLHFEGKPQAAKKRLQKLKTAGFINERPRRTFEPSVLFLTRKGLLLLQEKGVLAEYPAFDLPVLDRRARVSDLTIRHELEVMDVKTAFHDAVKTQSSLSIDEFSTWPLLNEFTAYRPGFNGAKVLVKPDGFIRILEKETNGDKFAHDFYLELDRSTETQDVLVTRAGCYLEYYRSGGFAVRNGATRAEFKEFPFRVLIVCKTGERRNNTAERLLQMNPPILTQVYLSTLEEATTNPLGAIWFRPVDYRDALKGTRFEVPEKPSNAAYKRNATRETLVETTVRKLPLLRN